MPARILIADDNAVFRSTLRQVLQGAGHWEIVEAHDGQEAIFQAVETQPDLVILDLAMPVKDGLAAAREISQLLPQTPIVMCTMHMSPYFESEAMKSGVRKMLSKSDSILLIEIVRQLLPATAAPDSVIHPIPPPPPADASTAAPAISTSPAEAEPPSPVQPKNVA